MTRPTEFVKYVCEHLAPLGQVRARSMFGGWGLYVDGAFCAIVHREILYLKVDAISRPEFEAKNCGTFQPFAGKTPIPSYHEAPAEVFEDAAEMLAWGRRALEAALRARNTNRLKPRRNRGKAGPANE